MAIGQQQNQGDGAQECDFGYRSKRGQQLQRQIESIEHLEQGIIRFGNFGFDDEEHRCHAFQIRKFGGILSEVEPNNIDNKMDINNINTIKGVQTIITAAEIGEVILKPLKKVNIFKDIKDWEK